MKALPSRARRSVLEYIAVGLIVAFMIAGYSWFLLEALSLDWEGAVFLIVVTTIYAVLASYPRSPIASWIFMGLGLLPFLFLVVGAYLTSGVWAALMVALWFGLMIARYAMF